MTKTQAHILELIAQLPLAERREIVAHIQDTRMLEDRFYDRLTPEQRARLNEGIAQADRGEGEDATTVLDRLTLRLGVVNS
jgi:hypothetical protein